MQPDHLSDQRLVCLGDLLRRVPFGVETQRHQAGIRFAQFQVGHARATAFDKRQVNAGRLSCGCEGKPGGQKGGGEHGVEVPKEARVARDGGA